MTRLGDNATKFRTIRMERRDGILQMTFHTDGGPLQWGLLPHGEFPEAFRDVGSDPENRVVMILRYTRVLFTQPLKRQLHDYLGYGLALEGMSVVDRTVTPDTKG